ncbi:protein STRUBBELIG-RECEPTOR FAMILY 2-like [Lotus japonicus]|uniref:protein STRUBBELIG-RECEPTOR FAMILY 2-like n=1 Tax=Lotus japonicus TaxID=34305 RepID=UPI0025889522|nr:protein STRUBBELIG-RECEPTOR FAMILY 2-like [Lotus japonicus]
MNPLITYFLSLCSKIQGLNITRYLGGLLHNLQNLKHMDVISNNIVGEIPYSLPPNATHINMACNYLSQNIPHSLPTMKKLRLLLGPLENQLKQSKVATQGYTTHSPTIMTRPKQCALWQVVADALLSLASFWMQLDPILIPTKLC